MKQKSLFLKFLTCLFLISPASAMEERVEAPSGSLSKSPHLAADMVGAAETFPRLIERRREDLYSCQLAADLFFVLEKVDSPPEVRKKRFYSYGYWESFMKEQEGYLRQHYEKRTLSPEAGSSYRDGISGFKYMLETVETPTHHELWVAYAAYRAVQEKASLPFEEIEMSFTVANDPDLPFTTHMGVARSFHAQAAGKAKHSNIAFDLHSFAAQIMNKIHPHKKAMITVPLKHMRSIFKAHLPASSISVGDNEHVERVKKAESDKRVLFSRTDLLEIDKMPPKERDSYLEKRAANLLTEWQQALRDSPPLISWDVHPTYSSMRTFILKNKAGEEIARLSKQDRKYYWFLVNKALYPREELPYVAIDLEQLAEARDWSFS